MKPEEFLDALWRERATAIIRCGSERIAAAAMEAAVRGGFRVIEFTLTTPGATDLIRDFAKRSDLIVGAGTVLSVEDARAAVDAGARFLVSPVCDLAVIDEAAQLGVAMMPGTFTPTEMLLAHRAGAQLVKLFPAPGIGPAYVRSTLGPLPFLRIVPTQGVHGDNVLDFLEAGAFAVGFVSSLFDPQDLREERFEAIERRARAYQSRLTLFDRGVRR